LTIMKVLRDKLSSYAACFFEIESHDLLRIKRYGLHRRIFDLGVRVNISSNTPSGDAACFYGVSSNIILRGSTVMAIS
jgi:hypothetical protein